MSDKPAQVRVGAYYGSPFYGEDQRIHFWLKLGECHAEMAVEAEDAATLQAALGKALVARELMLAGMEPEPELIALHDPSLRQRAEALAAHFGKEAYVFLPPDGSEPRCSPSLPESDLYLRVSPDGSTRLFDER